MALRTLIVFLPKKKSHVLSWPSATRAACQQVSTEHPYIEHRTGVQTGKIFEAPYIFAKVIFIAIILVVFILLLGYILGQSSRQVGELAFKSPLMCNTGTLKVLLQDPHSAYGKNNVVAYFDHIPNENRLYVRKPMFVSWLVISFKIEAS